MKDISQFSFDKNNKILLESYREMWETCDYISYDLYEKLLNETFYGDQIVIEGLDAIDNAVKNSLGKIKGVFNDLKTYIAPLAKEYNISLKDIVEGLKNVNIYNALKFFGFSIKKLLETVSKASILWNSGLKKIFDEIHKNKYIQKIHSGAMKIDDLLDKYPILKKISGPIIAGLLFYIWLNMSFIGNIETDLDLYPMIEALKGNFSLADLFSGPSGLMMIALFGTGSIVSFPWLGHTVGNILLALIYTSYKYVRKSDNPFSKKLKSSIKLS